MDCPEAKKTKGGEVAVACPPADSLVEILSRLHAKPLFRFKCVSKEWCDLIVDRLCCRKFPQTLEGFLTGRRVENYVGFMDVSKRPVPFIDPSFSFLPKLPAIENLVLLDSCNGLVLFGHRRISDWYDTLGYIVCNPATEQWVSVSTSCYYTTPDEDDDEYARDLGPGTYLIFDPAVSPHFQLVLLRLFDNHDLQEVHTFSSVTGTWRLELEDVPGLASGQMMVDAIPSVVCAFNGMLHLRAQQRHLPSENQIMILAVGGEGRPFRSQHWPQHDRGLLVFVGQSQGHLHCLSGCIRDDFQMTELSIWVLEDYNAEKWVLRDNVSLSQLFKRKTGRYVSEWNVVGIHPNRGLVYFVEFWNHKVISYDMDKKEVRALCSLEHGFGPFIIPYVHYFAESVVLAKKH